MKAIPLILAACLLFSPGTTSLQTPGTTSAQTSTLTVTITGLHSDKGRVYLSLYNSAEGYPKKASLAYRLAFNSIEKGKCTIVLTAIPKGVYALACYHDENGNGKLDNNFLGIPKEGTGASNNARGAMGPPKFDDAKFLVNSDTSQSIKINY